MQTVSKLSTTAILTSSLNPSAGGVQLSFSATVSPAVPDGEVVVFKDGKKTIGGGLTSGGVATLTTSGLSVGSHSITATYAGDSNYSGSASTALTQTVITGAATTTTLTSSLNPSTTGAPVTFTATVSPSAPDGETVTFYDVIKGKWNSSARFVLLGTGTTTGSVATLTISTLSAGAHSIVAFYSGDGADAPSGSSVLAQVVQPGATPE
jgi:hypothetical protein